MTMWLTTAVYLWLPLTAVVALDNGLALRPPMGWMSWVRFGCNVWCDIDADNCITSVYLAHPIPSTGLCRVCELRAFYSPLESTKQPPG